MGVEVGVNFRGGGVVEAGMDWVDMRGRDREG